MVKGAPKEDNVIIVDDAEDVEDDYPASAMPGVSRTAESLQEQLSKELGTDLSSNDERDSVNLRIVRPRSSRSPFPKKMRAIGVTIITLGVIIALIGLRSAMIYTIIVAVPSLIFLGYVMVHFTEKPTFEAMVYILLLSVILITGFGSSTSSGLEIYGTTLVLLLLLLFFRMTKSKLIIVPIILFIAWMIVFSVRFYQEEVL